MIHPQVHLGGTAKQDLVDQWGDAYTALSRAVAVLQTAGPHSRDYFLSGQYDYDGIEAFRLASNEHADRVSKLASVMADLNELREHIMFPDH
jgi:hypothetical protein